MFCILIPEYSIVKIILHDFKGHRLVGISVVRLSVVLNMAYYYCPVLKLERSLGRGGGE